MAEIVKMVVTVVEALAVVVALLKEIYKAVKSSLSLADEHEKLKRGLDRLRALRVDKEREVERDIVRKGRTELYKTWMVHVSGIEKDVSSLNQQYEEVNEKKWYHRQGKGPLLVEIKKALSRIDALLGDACLGNILVDRLQVERVIKEIDVQPIEKYETLTKAFGEIQKRLKEKGVNCVALCGEIGVGKTTIMRHLNNLFYNHSDNEDFDMVLFITMAADEQTDLEILHKIADRIKIDREVTDIDSARRIQQVLKDKRYLLILDGIKHKLDGIWGKLDLSNHKKGSKVVIASHYRPAWTSACVQRSVELGRLSLVDAGNMFQNIVGEDLFETKVVQKSTAVRVCDRLCYCLPLLIDPIARYFKNNPDIRWEQTLDQWTRWPQVGDEGVNELLSKLKSCYDWLGDKSKKHCFLYASLYPANSKIYTQHFVECCIVQELLKKADATAAFSSVRRQAINETLKYLVDVAFLEKGEEMRYVQMNDLYRQLALYISSNDPDSEFETYVDDEEAIASASCQRPIWLSMVGSERDSLTANQNFSRLQTLLLQKNLKLAEISKECLSSMRNLHVLNLYGTKIRKLPYLRKLAELKALYLNGCSELQIELSLIESLKNLQVLDIRGTEINSVPRWNRLWCLRGTEINSVPCLNKLWCLRMTYTKKGDCRGISKLNNLEELTIEVKFLREQWLDDAKCIAEKVASLKNLTTFGCSFPSSESRGRFEAMISEKLPTLKSRLVLKVKDL